MIRHIIIITLIISFINFTAFGNSMQQAGHEGKNFGEQEINKMRGKLQSIDEYKPQDGFDATRAMDMIKNDRIPETEADRMINDPKVRENAYVIDENDGCFNTSKEIYKNPCAKSDITTDIKEEECEIQKETHKCQESGSQYLVSTLRTRNVKVAYTP